MFFGFVFGGVYRKLLMKRVKDQRTVLSERDIREWEDRYIRE